MKNVLIWILVVVLAVGLGIGAAAGVAALIRQINPDLFNTATPLRRRQAIPTPRFRQPDVPGRPGWNQWGPGMRGDWDGSNTNPTGQRLTIDQATQAGTQYASSYGPNLYTLNGKIAGMLSVNGVSGDVWPHTWHGQFISEKEVTK